MRIALVINSTAGSGDLTPDEIRDKVVAAGLEVIPGDDRTADLTTRLESAAAQPDIEALVVAGGDGTMGCAASLMAGRDMPLGLLPLGTMNLLAKDLGIPIDVDGAIEVLRTGAVRRIDLGDVNGHVFITSSLLGTPARIAKHREARRNGGDWRSIARFVFSFVRHLGRYPRMAVTATLEGGRQHWRVRMLAIVNNDFVERPGNVLLREPLDGGRLTVYLMRELSMWRALRLGAGFATGDWHRLPGLERTVLSAIEIDSSQRALRVMNDGEVVLIDAPLRYTIRPRSLAVIAPKQAT